MAPTSAAQDEGQKRHQDYLSARESDPAKMGWMQGFPPPDSLLLSAADGSFFEFPALRWSVVHMRQFLPTREVSRGLGASAPFEYDLDTAAIDAVVFTPWGTEEPMTWEESLFENYTDGILILHEGAVVYERYFAALDETRKHAAMSVTKSFTGTLAALLVAEGTLDPGALATEYVPELEGSGFEGATVRQVMDMTTALDYSEDYSDPDAQIWTYAEAGDPFPKPESYDGPVGYYEYLPTLDKGAGEHGDAFAYKTPNADVLGWIVARASGRSVATLLSEKIWTKLGMEQSAYYQVDAQGTPSAGGGLSAGLRDMARFGEMIRGGGVWRGEQVVPQEVAAEIRAGGSQEAFAKSNHPELEEWSYKDMWWITHNDHGAFAARGVHGQTIYIDPAAEMVIVRFASHPVAANAANDPFSLPAYEAVAEYLMNQN